MGNVNSGRWRNGCRHPREEHATLSKSERRGPKAGRENYRNSGRTTATPHGIPQTTPRAPPPPQHTPGTSHQSGPSATRWSTRSATKGASRCRSPTAGAAMFACGARQLDHLLCMHVIQCWRTAPILSILNSALSSGHSLDPARIATRCGLYARIPITRTLSNASAPIPCSYIPL